MAVFDRNYDAFGENEAPSAGDMLPDSSIVIWFFIVNVCRVINTYIKKYISLFAIAFNGA